MRANSMALAATFVVSQSLTPLAGRAQASRFEGAWKHIGGEVVTPDSSYEVRPINGLVVIHGRYFSQTWAPTPRIGVPQAGGPMDAASKAARYDVITTNAGTIEVSSKTFVSHFLEAKNPALVGQSVTYEYRFHGDTLFTSRSDPIGGDRAKVRHSNLIFVRAPLAEASKLDGAWRHLSTDVAAPDTNLHFGALKGLGVIHRGSFSQTWSSVPAGGVRQAGEPA